MKERDNHADRKKHPSQVRCFRRAAGLPLEEETLVDDPYDCYPDPPRLLDHFFAKLRLRAVHLFRFLDMRTIRHLFSLAPVRVYALTETGGHHAA